MGAEQPRTITGTSPEAIADELLAAADAAALVSPISANHPDFGIEDAYDVLDHIGRRRTQRGWTVVGRKIGFTNRTIWPLYGVDAPMWAPMWDRTVLHAENGRITLPLAGLVQPRIEPEVVFRLGGRLDATDDAATALAAVESVAAGFEVVQCPYPDWKFALPDCTAAFGLHGALIVGREVTLDGRSRTELLDVLATFEVSLQRDRAPIDHGVGSNVLGTPALSLAHLARVLQTQPQFDALAQGELVTTGTLTNAWPVAPGETWTCDYGSLGVDPVELTFS